MLCLGGESMDGGTEKLLSQCMVTISSNSLDRPIECQIDPDGSDIVYVNNVGFSYKARFAIAADVDWLC